MRAGDSALGRPSGLPHRLADALCNAHCRSLANTYRLRQNRYGTAGESAQSIIRGLPVPVPEGLPSATRSSRYQLDTCLTWQDDH